MEIYNFQLFDYFLAHSESNVKLLCYLHFPKQCPTPFFLKKILFAQVILEIKYLKSQMYSASIG